MTSRDEVGASGPGSLAGPDGSRTHRPGWRWLGVAFSVAALALGSRASPLGAQTGASSGAPTRPASGAPGQDGRGEDRGPGVIALQAAAGVAGSWALGLPAFRYLEAHAGDRRVKGDAGYSPTANAGLIVTSALGNALAVYLAGEAAGADGSLWGTLIGAGLGSLPLVLGVDDPYLPYYALTVGVALQDLGSLVGFGF